MLNKCLQILTIAKLKYVTEVYIIKYVKKGKF